MDGTRSAVTEIAKLPPGLKPRGQCGRRIHDAEGRLGRWQKFRRLGRYAPRACSHYLSASTIKTKLIKARKTTSSFSNLEKMRRNPFSLRKSLSTSLRFL